MKNHPPPGTRVLLVEDSPDILELLELALQGRGYELEKASGVDEALEVWNNCGGSIDLLITDIQLGPNGCGLELAERLLALKPSLSLMAVSGWCPPEGFMVSGRKIAFLKKPFLLKEVAQAIQALLTRGGAKAPFVHHAM
jgi:two-component system cell cycle sensor histidine kinase/response regulator CckA